MREPPQQLFRCSSRDEQSRWVERALRAGSTLSGTELWLSGVDRPEELIENLRGKGLALVETTKRMRDAANVQHDVQAWRLESPA